VDEGQPTAYGLLDKGVPVYASDGEQVGTVLRVVADQREDIFHGLVISSGTLDHRFVAAEEVAALHERGVDLKIDSAAAQQLPRPEGAVPVYTEDPGAVESRWIHWSRRLTGRKDWRKQR
jgi:sporulation protein YlmC with PRC-barrel domain